MKICIICGSITYDNPTSCTYCENKDMRVVRSMKISMGKFDGIYECSDEENKFLKMLSGIQIIKNGD
jgi:hypothetical protein